jgi:hypothetical protein
MDTSRPEASWELEVVIGQLQLCVSREMEASRQRCKRGSLGMSIAGNINRETTSK